MHKTLFSPAKINLGLSIVGRREDGFHLLESLFWPITFGDTIEVTPGTGRVHLTWAKDSLYNESALPGEEDNIVTKVLRTLPKLELNYDITIKKRIPLGGGMGGGSSNIGTLLRHLHSQSRLSVEDLPAWSCQFGADIPFFLSSSPAWVTGVGEKVRPLRLLSEELKTLHFLILLFPFGCETKQVFRAYQQSNPKFSPRSLPFKNDSLSRETLLRYLKEAKNDLESVVSTLYPNIGLALEKLRKSQAIYAGLSGSGSTCYAVFDSMEILKKTTQELHSFFRTYNCKSILAETFLPK